MNHYHKKIEQLRADQALDQESLGEVLLDLDKQPDNKERKAQREKLEASITRRDTEMRRLHLMATTAEKLDTKAAGEARAKATDAAGKLYATMLDAVNARAPKIDKAIEDLPRLFTEQEADLNAAMRAGREAGISSSALQYLLDMAPLGVALADRLARGGWTRLPFIDVTHRRYASPKHRHRRADDEPAPREGAGTARSCTEQEMKPREHLPAGTAEHRADFQALARRCAVDLAQVIGSGEGKFPGGRRYRLLPVGDPHCYDATSKFLAEVESQAGALFDRAVEARDLPAEHNVHQLRKRA